jgi:hypothetical protein
MYRYIIEYKDQPSSMVSTSPPPPTFPTALAAATAGGGVATVFASSRKDFRLLTDPETLTDLNLAIKVS